MRKLFQLTLLLSCLLIFCSHNTNAIGQIDVWTTGHTLEESFNDTDNHDLHGTPTNTFLFTASLSLKKNKLFHEININNIELTHGLIRAPPSYII
jgi:hypothetical protein